MAAMLRDQKGFTLIEIISVHTNLGILAAVAIPKYLDIQNFARVKAASGQIAETKGRLSTSLAVYMLSNSGTIPADGAALLTYANSINSSCPTASTTEGDFTFMCAAGADSTVTITVTAVQGLTLTTAAVGSYPVR
jgi:type II secretory pathway pseudopilin PulG